MIRQHVEGSRDDDSGLDAQGRPIISIFYGDNTKWWLSRAEEIFSKNRLSEAQKIEAATACFDWRTWNWLQDVHRQRTVQTWRELKGLMIDRFGLSQEDTNWNPPQQEDTIREKLMGVVVSPLAEGSELVLLLQNTSKVERREREEQRPEATSTETTISSEIPIKIKDKGVSMAGRSCHEETAIRGNRRLIGFSSPPLPTNGGAILEGHGVNGHYGLKRLGKTEAKRPKSHDLGQIMEWAQGIGGTNASMKQAHATYGPPKTKIDYYSPNPQLHYFPAYSSDLHHQYNARAIAISHKIATFSVLRSAKATKGAFPLKWLTNTKLGKKNNKWQNYHETHTLSVSYNCLPIRRVFLLENSRGGATGYGICRDNILIVCHNFLTAFGLKYSVSAFAIGKDLTKEMVRLYGIPKL